MYIARGRASSLPRHRECVEKKLFGTREEVIALKCLKRADLLGDGLPSKNGRGFVVKCGKGLKD